MKTLVQTKASVAWLALVVLTVTQWAIGTHDGVSGPYHVPASVVIFFVGVFKVRLVGLYFMELREAPVALRSAFETYCVVLLAVLCGMFLFA
jgi:Prokaryotic Cytochrome C oxidase subunit IV